MAKGPWIGSELAATGLTKGNAMAQSTSPDPPKEFGSLLCHDDGSGAMLGLLILAALGLGLVIGAVFAFLGARPILGGVILILGLLLLVLVVRAVARGSTRTWFYENGVVQEAAKNVRMLAYRDVAQVGYGAWFQANSDVTYLNIDLRPCSGGPDLKFSAGKSSKDKATPTRMSENQVHQIGAMLVQMAAKRVQADLDRGQTASWTANVELRPDGLWLANEGRLVPWKEIASTEINQGNGYIEVCTHGAPKPIVKLSNSVMNARVGMVVIQARCGLAEDV
jgi:hypothetical protein